MNAQEAARTYLAAHGATHLEAKHRLKPEPERLLALVAALHDVHRGLEEAGLRHVFFKGPVLAKQLYGDIAARSCADIDVLVDDPAAALEALPDWQPIQAVDVASSQVRAARNAIALTRGGVGLEVHWRPFRKGTWPAHAVPDLQHDARPIDLGIQVPAAAGIPALHHIMLHAASSGWRRLIWVTDAAEWLRQRPHDLRPLLQRATKTHTTRAIHAGLALAQEACGLRIPGLPAPSRPDRRIVAHVRDDWLRPGIGGKGYQSWIHVHRFDRRRDIVRYFWHRGFQPTPEDHALIRLPRPFHFAYWAIRPFHAIGSALAARLRRPR